jgi:hypothetical protein
MLQLAVSGIKAVTLVAVAMPGAHFLAGALENAFGVNDPLHDIFDAIGKWLESAADIFAKIGNAIGVDDLAGAGKDGLKGPDFYKNFGIIPKVIGNLAGNAPAAVDIASKNPTPAIIGGVTALAVASADTKFTTALHDEGAKVAGTVVNVARQAGNAITSTAQFANDSVIEPTKRIIGGRGGQASSKPMQPSDNSRLQPSV